MWTTKPSLPATSTNLSKFTSYPCSLCFGRTGHIRYSKHAPASGPLHLPVPSACNALHPDILMAGTLISFRCLTKYQLIREDPCNYIWNRNSFCPYHLKNTLNCAWFFHRILSHSLFPEKFWLFCGNDHHQTLVAKHNKNVWFVQHVHFRPAGGSTYGNPSGSQSDEASCNMLLPQRPQQW